MTTARSRPRPGAAPDSSIAAACCAPLLGDAPDEHDAAELATAFRALADPVRLRLLSLISARGGGEACACELVGVLGRSQPTISHHLSLLHDVGLLERERRGRWIWYRVVPERVAAVRDALAPARSR